MLGRHSCGEDRPESFLHESDEAAPSCSHGAARDTKTLEMDSSLTLWYGREQEGCLFQGPSKPRPGLQPFIFRN